eukprot:scaffold605_cov346-Pavlova_lutheri.AAC.3
MARRSLQRLHMQSCPSGPPGKAKCPDSEQNRGTRCAPQRSPWILLTQPSRLDTDPVQLCVQGCPHRSQGQGLGMMLRGGLALFPG